MPNLQFQQTLGDLVPVVAATASNRPSSTTFWDKYPNFDWYGPKNVWEKVGGSLGTWGARNSGAGGDYENTCATRVSYALNYSGAEIPASARSVDPGGFKQNLATPAYNGLQGDMKWYIIRASTLDKYLRSIWGKPGYIVRTAKDYQNTMSHLDAQHQQIAVFATSRSGSGHSGVIKKGYQDPYILTELPVDVWLLP